MKVLIDRCPCAFLARLKSNSFLSFFGFVFYLYAFQQNRNIFIFFTKIYFIDSDGKIHIFQGSIIKGIIFVLNNCLDVDFCKDVDEAWWKDWYKEDKQDQGETAPTDSLVGGLAIPSEGWLVLRRCQLWGWCFGRIFSSS